MPRFQDPYAPAKRPPVPPRPDALPMGRLRRLAVTQGAAKAVTEWWAAIGLDGRLGQIERWGVMTDDDLGEELAEIDGLFDGSVNAVLSWVRQHEDRAMYAKLALAVEHVGRAGSERASAVSQLEAMAVAT